MLLQVQQLRMMFRLNLYRLPGRDKQIKMATYQKTGNRKLNGGFIMTSGSSDASLKVFSLNSNHKLAEDIAAHTGTTLGKCVVSRFRDGEIQISIEESVRGSDVYVIQSTSAPVNQHIMELLIMIDALKRASASSINIVMRLLLDTKQ